jgi:hypothetical protein
MTTQKITLEVEVYSPNELNDSELKDVKEAVKRTLYEYDNFTGILLEDEYHLQEVYTSCADENDNEDTTEETEETKE